MFATAALRRNCARLLSQAKRQNSTTPPTTTPVPGPSNAYERHEYQQYLFSRFFVQFGDSFRPGKATDSKLMQTIKREKFATVLLAGTAAYIPYAHSREPKDTKLFDRRGDFAVPIISPFLTKLRVRFHDTVKIYPHSDPYKDFTDEERTEVIDTLHSAGFFDQFWQDQKDDYDRKRLLIATTQHALILKTMNAYYFPEDENTNIDKMRKLQATQYYTKQPRLEVQVGDDNVVFTTKAESKCNHIIEAYDAMFQTEEEKQFEKAAYKFNTAVIPSDFSAYEKLNGL